MKLKNTFRLLTTFLLSSIIGQAQFTQLNGPEACIPNCFAKISAGILCGSKQNLYISPDEGRNWIDFPGFQGKQIYSILTASDTMVLLYDSGIDFYDHYDSVRVTKSFDGGLTWPLDTLINTFPFRPSLNRLGSKIFASSGLSFFESDDFGSSYDSMSMPDGGQFAGYLFSNNFLLLMSDSMGIKYYITDSTFNFSRVDSLDLIQNKFIIDSLIFGYRWGPTGYVSIMKSEDKGVTWNTTLTIDSTIFGYFRSVDNLLYWVDRSNNYTISNDFGISWNASPIPYQLQYQNRYHLTNGDELSWSNELKNVVHYIPTIDSAYLSCSGMRGSSVSNLVGNSDVLYCRMFDQGFFHKSENIGTSWDTIYKNMAPLIVSGDSIFSTNGYFLRSYDRGITWQQGLNTGSSTNIILYYPPIRINNRFYCQTSTNFYYSDDLGDNWTSLPPIPFITGCTTTSNFSGTLCNIGNILIATTYSGDIFKFDPVTFTWTHLYCVPSQSSNLYQTHTTCINNILISTTASTLYTSLDSGVTWNQSQLNGIPEDHTGTLITPQSIVGRNGEIIGIVRKNGIYSSSNNGIDWTPLYSNLPFESRHLTLINDRLYVGSDYQGIWRENTILGVGYISNSEKELSVYPNPTNGNIHLKTPGINENILLEIFDLQGKFLKSTELKSAETEIELENFSNGIYIGKLLSESGKVNYQFKISIIK